jgi:hypothetical protein
LELSADAAFSSVALGGPTSQTSVALKPLAPGQTYYWRVKGSAWGTGGTWSAVWSFTTTGTPLTAPTLTAPSNGDTTVTLPVTLQWDAVAGAVGYLVQISEAANFSGIGRTIPTKELQVTLPYLPTGVQLYWRVEAVAGGVQGPWSAVWSFTLPAVTLTAPTLTAPANGDTTVTLPVTLQWSAVPGATGYGVQISEAADFSGIGRNYETKDTQLTLPALPEGVALYWRVRAMVPSGGWGPWSSTPGPWSDVWSFTIPAVTLTAPTLAAPANAATGVTPPVTLQWEAVTGASGYEVQISKVADFSSQTMTLPTQGTQTKLPFLPGGATVYWRVRAVVVSGWGTTSLTKGPWSDTWSFTTVTKT